MLGPPHAGLRTQNVQLKALLHTRACRASAARAAGTPCHRACSPWTAAASATTPAAAPPSAPRCRRARLWPRPSPPRHIATTSSISCVLQCPEGIALGERPLPLLAPTISRHLSPYPSLKQLDICTLWRATCQCMFGLLQTLHQQNQCSLDLCLSALRCGARAGRRACASSLQ